MRSQWTIWETDGDRQIVFIVDNGGATTITNDAESVLENLKFRFGTDWRVVYKDTDGEWWEIVPEHKTWMGVGIGFEPWHGKVWDILKN